MSRKSVLVRNDKRIKMVQKYAHKRAKLKEEIKKAAGDIPLLVELYGKLSKLPRDSSPVRVRNRCGITGRPRGYIRKYGVSRVYLRKEGYKDPALMKI